ncbi:adenylate cyclase type 9-like isoform X2 [Physella acuta]|uniref:adenylate cyclase type 9-like isoform X2 n=1 Tax=Physella acuta TaxID=109671 RepID=UPI0027DC35BB|nr:adenylate cyclase type 9-like isoform X2 [Physella acuta]
MANSSSSNGEPSHKETVVKFSHNSTAVDADFVEVKMPKDKIKKSSGERGFHLLPKLFERSNGSLFNPKFDSEILENHLVKVNFPHVRRMFRSTVQYQAVAALSFMFFFGLKNINPNFNTDHWYYFVAGAGAVLALMLFLLFVTFTKHYEKHTTKLAYLVAIILIIAIQLPYIYENPDITSIGTFCGVVEIVMVLYSFFPITLYTAAGLGGLLSLSYEAIIAWRFSEMRRPEFIICKLLLHFIVHFMGIFIYIMSNARARSNFSKVGQSVRLQRDLQIEREIKEKMIHSLMPPQVAKLIMATNPGQQEEENPDEEEDAEKKRRRKPKHVKGEMIFRKFQMDEMKNVSILFADIVGFTKMSSNKTAERLVGLLNDLFGRFDKLCSHAGCEKISTLGDCYYCVSGCPNPCEQHAKNCVEMGLNMCIAIRNFDEDHAEEVNMRVGVHTGTVLCGIVGTVRFKFDVWSNDVTMANIMESSGEPGKVHISESTRSFIVDEYDMTEGEEVADFRGRKELIEHYDPAQSSFIIKHREETRNVKTYFIVGRRPGNIGIPGLEQLADERPPELRRDRAPSSTEIDTSGKPAPPVSTYTAYTNSSSAENDVDGGKGTAELLSMRAMLHPVTSEDKPSDDPNAKADTTLLEKEKKFSITDQDKLLIELMEQESSNDLSLFKPSLNKWSLNFDKELEHEYRHQFIDSLLFEEKMLSSPRYQMAVEAFVASLVLALITFCCHIMFDFARTTGFITLTVVSLTLQSLVFVDTITNIVWLEKKKKKFPKYMRFTQSWFFRNTIGVVMATLPAVLIYTNMSCALVINKHWNDRFFCYSIVVALLQYCNYSMLRFIAKSIVAFILGSVLIFLLFANLCSDHWEDLIEVSNDTSAFKPQLFYGHHLIRYETILNIVLLLLLITVINYEFENSYRLSFYASQKAQRDKENMQLNKDQADWLLHNIIPAHLAELFKHNRSYSQNHMDVGVIFATIVNFNEFYDETYAGGREYLRVLNELVSDYEVMLSEPRFKDVEKIKTISSSFMAAAGLNEESRAKNRHPYAHLFALMDFAMELLNVVHNFNESIFNFEFILKIGYNYGPVTSGVIGTTKLLYDIWGDTVNIASRMYSTGEENRIQLPQSSVDLLSCMFDFTYRDEIFVKGKGMMKTYLLVGKKRGANWE